ncbi:ABC transporter substrate-binding protein [Murimonas intestini]|uniref:Carbohydrate ABC transporter substrate-binding protein (CUT1 family) n=1 Tax=Murimonas intestini TaxID=1337051 RepID=A0AB73T7G6_9FIRM|nr:ABC transporter substrate-binding protein [Murimonas intestini]MCR1841231.1 ABC transporter substrate-binding protein [Murimonas intestini]MCR1866149.1 ABC transporter substrate-binding protein [Murimonas intestini]MCR1882734.1 ABC transporter substrate-binding protein [Murimonas intestini]
MKKKSVMAASLAVMLAGSVFMGGAGSVAKAADSAEDKEPVTLRFSWWGGDERNEATLQVIDNFEKEYPWITIEPEFGGDQGYLEKLSTSLAGGQAADIIQNGPGWMPSFMSKGDFFIDFNEYKDNIDLSGFSEEYLENTCTYNDKLVGLPSGIGTTALLVNKTLADEIGLDFSGDVTWEGLTEMGKKVQEYNSDMYLLNIDTSFLVTNVFRPYIMQITGTPFVNDETKSLSCSEEELTQVLSYIRSLYDDRVVQPAGETASFEGAPQTNPKWINGECVAVMTNASQINNLTSANEDAEYMVVSMPEMQDKEAQKNEGYYANPPQLMCVNKSSEHIEEAVMFLDYFFNNEEAAAILKDLRSVPPTESARQICEEKGLISSLVTTAVNLGLEKNGINEMGLTTDSEVEAVIKTMIESVSFGESTPEEACESGIDMLENILSEK